MTVRFKLALTVFVTGLVTALLVIATVIYAFQRFERETAYARGTAFLARAVASDDRLLSMYERSADEFQSWLRSLVLFEPDTQLYLLDLQGRVLATSGHAVLPAGFKVALQPVLQAVGRADAAYVMGDDPERMDADAVVAVQPVRRGAMRPDDPVVGYMYLVLHTGQLPADRWAALRMSVARPALGLIAAVVAFTTGVAVAIIVSVTRPLRRLTEAIASISQRGLDTGLSNAPATWLPPDTPDEFGQLTRAFEMMLATLRRQWGEMRRLDRFRREGVSNLSHDLRSPLTATVACLETLEVRWSAAAADASAGAPRAMHTTALTDATDTADMTSAPSHPDPSAADDLRLIEIALRNTRNAARLVQSLGDLAQLDEPEFQLKPEWVDAGELLDDIGLRFAQRAARQGVMLSSRSAPPPAQDDAEMVAPVAPAPVFAPLDIELFERAIANLVDNALKFSPAGGRVLLAAVARAGRVEVSVEDTGPGIAAADLPHLFDRFYQSRHSVAPATGEGGKGLGLAIVKRIAELHGGTVQVESQAGIGTRVVITVPAGSQPEADRM